MIIDYEGIDSYEEINRRFYESGDCFYNNPLDYKSKALMSSKSKDFTEDDSLFTLLKTYNASDFWASYEIKKLKYKELVLERTDHEGKLLRFVFKPEEKLVHQIINKKDYQLIFS